MDFEYSKGNGVIGDVKTSQIVGEEYKIVFIFDGQDVKYPSLLISMEEYDELKHTGRCESINIIRTRRGMIWRKYDRVKHESENVDQYSS